MTHRRQAVSSSYNSLQPAHSPCVHRTRQQLEKQKLQLRRLVWEAVIDTASLQVVVAATIRGSLVDSSNGGGVGKTGVAEGGGGGVAGGGNGHTHLIGGINVDGGGHLDDLLLDNGDVIGDLHTPLDVHGLVDGVDLGLLVDDGGGHGLATAEDGGHLDGEVGGGGLVDGGGVAGDVVGGAIVDLLGDNGGG